MLVPLVNEDGSFDEAEMPSFYPRYRRIKNIEPDFLLAELIKDMEVIYDEYENTELAYQIQPGKICWVIVYVHTKYLSHIDSEFRKGAIEHELKKGAPWLFTYGKRRVDGENK